SPVLALLAASRALMESADCAGAAGVLAVDGCAVVGIAGAVAAARGACGKDGAVTAGAARCASAAPEARKGAICRCHSCQPPNTAPAIPANTRVPASHPTQGGTKRLP